MPSKQYKASYSINFYATSGPKSVSNIATTLWMIDTVMDISLGWIGVRLASALLTIISVRHQESSLSHGFNSLSSFLRRPKALFSHLLITCWWHFDYSLAIRKESAMSKSWFFKYKRQTFEGATGPLLANVRRRRW